MKHLSEEEQILLYYNETGTTETIRAHVAECAACRAASAALARVLDSCNEWQVPEPDAGFERRIKAGLTPVHVMPVREWLFAAVAVAAVLLITFFAGRVTRRSQPSVFAGLSSQAQHRILEISLADHLDRAELLLTEIANAPDSEQVDRTRAQDLVDEGRLMRQTLAREGESATLALMDEVERFMLEAANTPDQAGVRALRERITSDSLLFKVRIIEANLRTQGQRT
jgi:hypothetical protein